MHNANPTVAAPGHAEEANREGNQDPLEDLRHAIEHAAHLLPSQGPITVFVHHNTLHAFEDLPFEDGLRAGHQTFGCEPFLPEDHYRKCLVSGRIRQDELAAVLTDDLGDRADVMLGRFGTRFRLRMAMLEHPLQLAPSTELRWVVAETDALRRFRNFVHGPTRLRLVAETRHWVMRDLRTGENGSPDPTAGEDEARIRRYVGDLMAVFGKKTIESWSDERWESFCLHLLWRLCLDGSRSVASSPPDTGALPLRHAALLKRVVFEDPDQLVDELLIRFCAAFLDQGYANWRLPERDRGFYRSFAHLYAQRCGPPDGWLRGLPGELRRLDERGLSPIESIDESLRLLGVEESEREAYVTASLQALPGWAGMIWQMETNAEWTLKPAPRGSLQEYLAVRLILDRLAVSHVARTALGWYRPLSGLRSELRTGVPEVAEGGVEQHAFLLFQLAQVQGWLPQELYALPAAQWQLLIEEIDQFGSFERRRVFQRAYERRFRNQALDALAVHCGNRHPLAHESAPRRVESRPWMAPRPAAAVAGNGGAGRSGVERVPAFQIVCCIDDREESFRRHLEEVAPACETFGAAGFFGVAMYYRGAADAHPRPLCPVIIKPRHYVHEEVVETLAEEHKRRAETRRVLGAASYKVHLGSRTFFGGVLTALGGTLASIPLVARILFPRATAQIRRLFGGLLRAPATTRLTLQRSVPEPGPENGHVGYSLEEMTQIVERLLRDIGLIENFAPFVLVCGHGSASLNNPHESAYNCGACSGGLGGPNARAFAQMANNPQVREGLAARGIHLPPNTTFVGAFHNTCDDQVTYFDLDQLTESQRVAFQTVREAIDEARRRNAHERCRRFESAPLSLNFEGALRHVENRSEDLSQARPEYNHATDALVLVGQRWWSRGLFLDRRAFLQSYDPAVDDAEHQVLARILGAVIPVCAGIGLEYYFSCVDPTVLGCGSKLPHNITSLLGVMEGAASDLRPGLSQQMIEIHEPMRILFVIQSTPEALVSIMDRNPVIGRLCRNEWVQLALLDPETRAIRVWRDGKFKPYRPRSQSLPVTHSSADWYRGWRDHLAFAEIQEPAPAQPPTR